jgi:hypothetical protein
MRVVPLVITGTSHYLITTVLLRETSAKRFRKNTKPSKRAGCIQEDPSREQDPALNASSIISGTFCHFDTVSVHANIFFDENKLPMV